MSELERILSQYARLKAVPERESEWCPHSPWPKQREFVDLDCLEALYGGAAGGGKSDALLMAALRFVHVPGYSALLLRRTFPDLALPGAIMDRADAWLRGTRAEWNGQEKRWTFPSGAVIQFGYCDTKDDLARYKSAEFQFVGVDELTEWIEDWYAFLFSRIRRAAGVDLPLRMRGGTNPDGPGQTWVRRRFQIPESTSIELPIWSSPQRVFYPARAEDNPSLDLPAYETALEQMAGGRGGIKWRQLREGIWIPDLAGLVYKYDPSRNSVTHAPPLTTYILGIDYGFRDETAFAVLGYREHDPTVYVVECREAAQLTPSEAAQVVVELQRTYSPVKIVGDTQGLGKGYAEEARSRFALPIEAADKNNKRGFIQLMNDALAARCVVVVEPACAELVTEWQALCWDDRGQKEAPGFANHCADAALYAWRATTAYLNTPERKTPPKGSREWLDSEERRLEADVDRELEDEDREDRRNRRMWRGVGF